ncbi:hypothetical protein [Dialister invisus]|uniref:hypothetical protein n=1 Tax=Dialister invisus TaxID=218538 RepID=UPI00351FE28E
MISDKEARRYILQQLYDEGYRYLARDKDGILVAHRTKPHKVVSIFSWRNNNSAPCFVHNYPCFANLSWVDEEPLDIAKELGLIDWTKVPKDTPVLVWNKEGECKKRAHFSHYVSTAVVCPFRVFIDGGTSWSKKNVTARYTYCELANGGDLND